MPDFFKSKKTIMYNKINDFSKKSKLLSGRNIDLKLPFSNLALGLEYIGPAMSDPDYFYWCISPIDDEEGKTHLFVSRWKTKHNFKM